MTLSYRRLLPDFCHLSALVERLKVAAFFFIMVFISSPFHRLSHLLQKFQQIPIPSYFKPPAHEKRIMEPNQQGQWVRVGARSLKEHTCDVISTVSVINIQLRDFLLSSISEESNCEGLITG